jgi:hypothetical protein
MLGRCLTAPCMQERSHAAHACASRCHTCSRQLSSTSYLNRIRIAYKSISGDRRNERRSAVYEQQTVAFTWLISWARTVCVCVCVLVTPCSRRCWYGWLTELSTRSEFVRQSTASCTCENCVDWPQILKLHITTTFQMIHVSTFCFDLLTCSRKPFAPTPTKKSKIWWQLINICISIKLSSICGGWLLGPFDRWSQWIAPSVRVCCRKWTAHGHADKLSDAQSSNFSATV